MIWLEVLDRRGGVRERVRLDQFPATIGRGYGNTLVLDDPYVDPRHAQIALSEDGRLTLEDLGSVNGIRDGGPERLASLLLRPGATFQLGETTLRLATDQLPVPPARPLPQRQTESRLFRPLVATATGLAAAGLYAFGEYLGEGSRVAVGDVFTSATAMLLILCVWAGGWALATRFISHRFRFGAHFAVGGVALIAFLALSELSAWTQTIWPDSLVLQAFDWLYTFLGLGAVVYAHLQVVSRQEPSRRLRQALIFNVALVGLAFLVTLGDDDKFSIQLSYPGALRPLPSRWVSATSPDGLEKALGDLQREVDELKR